MSGQLVEKKLKDVKAGEWFYLTCLEDEIGPVRLSLGKCVHVGDPSRDAYYPTLIPEATVKVIQDNTEGFDWRPLKWVEATEDTSAWTRCRCRDTVYGAWVECEFCIKDARTPPPDFRFIAIRKTSETPEWYKYCEVLNESS